MSKDFAISYDTTLKKYKKIPYYLRVVEYMIHKEHLLDIIDEPFSVEFHGSLIFDSLFEMMDKLDANSGSIAYNGIRNRYFETIILGNKSGLNTGHTEFEMVLVNLMCLKHAELSDEAKYYNAVRAQKTLSGIYQSAAAVINREQGFDRYVSEYIRALSLYEQNHDKRNEQYTKSLKQIRRAFVDKFYDAHREIKTSFTDDSKEPKKIDYIDKIDYYKALAEFREKGSRDDCDDTKDSDYFDLFDDEFYE